VSKRMVRALRAMGLRLPCGDVGQSTWVPQSPECGEQATGHWLLGAQRVSHDPELRPALRERVILGQIVASRRGSRQLEPVFACQISCTTSRLAMILGTIIVCSWHVLLGDVGSGEVDWQLGHVHSGSDRWRVAGVRLACDAPNPCCLGLGRLLCSVEP
jgi:hypothetical protein